MIFHESSQVLKKSQLIFLGLFPRRVLGRHFKLCRSEACSMSIQGKRPSMLPHNIGKAKICDNSEPKTVALSYNSSTKACPQNGGYKDFQLPTVTPQD